MGEGSVGESDGKESAGVVRQQSKIRPWAARTQGFLMTGCGVFPCFFARLGHAVLPEVSTRQGRALH